MQSLQAVNAMQHQKSRCYFHHVSAQDVSFEVSLRCSSADITVCSILFR